MNPKHLYHRVIMPALNECNLAQPARCELVLGTAYVESAGHHLAQIGGPARGLWQMEPATTLDIWVNYLNQRGGRRRTEIRNGIERLCLIHRGKVEQVIGNLYYAAAMCAVHYYRAPGRLPKQGDVKGYAEYWKKYYNTEKGAGTIDHFMKAWQDQVMGSFDD